jgi:hypothetical protein
VEYEIKDSLLASLAKSVADPRTPESVTLLLPSEKSRQLAQLQVKASYKQAKEFRELAQKVKAG